ncbi:hypothetical protein R3W88_010892 [Solanum pinnatisectum]|uniref:Dihydroflavonol 4-reductase n=1 Tax=Solanum pinnatisectum TaxID=50273 RepID=A0AAV9L5A0_9SOLN|nr:hypothetical protein R3W88_010892 [Solanum pinnatisectum]
MEIMEDKSVVIEENSNYKGKVCVTGASGFVASWLIKSLLLSGYNVIGTVRDPGNQKKVGHLWKLQGAKERLRLMKANLTDEGSFDDAIMGCEGVFHTASPVLGKATFDVTVEILNPAVDGTLNVLRSCKKNPRLRRVVLTSSSSTVRVRDDIDPNIPLDESSWSSVEFCKKFEIWYVLSKTLAEKAAWEFCEQNNIDLVTLLPSFIIGPSLPPDLCSTADDFDFHGRMGYVHIDDVALSHILVYEHPSAHGRYLCSSKVLDNNQLVSVLSERYPSLPIPKRFKELDRPSYDFNTLKLEGLGMKFKSIEEMFDDCVAFFKERGLISSI